MSTWIYLKCNDHNPPIMADDESGQHLYDVPQVREDIANRDFVVKAYLDGWMSENRYRTNTARFLSHHPTCSVSIMDEYGVDRTEEDDGLEG